MHERQGKLNQEEARKRKEYISVGMNYSGVSKKGAHIIGAVVLLIPQL